MAGKIAPGVRKKAAHQAVQEPGVPDQIGHDARPKPSLQPQINPGLLCDHRDQPGVGVPPVGVTQEFDAPRDGVLDEP